MAKVKAKRVAVKVASKPVAKGGFAAYMKKGRGQGGMKGMKVKMS